MICPWSYGGSARKIQELLSHGCINSFSVFYNLSREGRKKCPVDNEDISEDQVCILRISIISYVGLVGAFPIIRQPS